MKKICIALMGALVLGGVTSCGGSENSSKPVEDAMIKAYTRDTTSGTRDGFFSTIGFKEAVSSDEVLVKDVIPVESNGDMLQSIKNDEFGIGYASLSGLEGVKPLSYEGVTPTEENVINGTYGLKRNFNYVIRTDFDSEQEKQIVDAFVQYMGTQEGKTTIKANGGIIDIKSTDPKWSDLKDTLPITKEDNSNITIKFGGSTSVSKIAQALSSEFSTKCGNFKVQHNHTGSGDAFKRVQGTEKDSQNKLDIGFASREFKLSDKEPCAEGSYGRICIDAIAVIVNNKNTITEINSEQLHSIYDGTFTKWSEVE